MRFEEKVKIEQELRFTAYMLNQIYYDNDYKLAEEMLQLLAYFSQITDYELQKDKQP